MPWVCRPCGEGLHDSHDGSLFDGVKPTPAEDHLDLYDCKTVSSDGTNQCMCRATWPRDRDGSLY